MEGQSFMLNEADTRVQLIDPVLYSSGGDNTKIKRELVLTDGRIIDPRGTRKKGKKADYV